MQKAFGGVFYMDSYEGEFKKSVKEEQNQMIFLKLSYFSKKVKIVSRLQNTLKMSRQKKENQKSSIGIIGQLLSRIIQCYIVQKRLS